MGIEWDPAKASANLKKHGIDFADGAVALEDERALTRPDPASGEEQRFVTLCMDPMGRLLVVAFTFRGESVRLISARQATRSEQRQYEVRR